jgi:hypothetical protein
MNILISGDSWSQGEWAGTWRQEPSTYGVHHPGINQYLQDAGHSVVNVGAGAIGNLQALENLNHQLDNCKFDCLIFFFTDPLRDCNEQEIKVGKLFELLEIKTNLFLERIDEIKTRYTDLKIILIGGYAKIETDNKNIDYIIPSIIELLVPGHVDTKCADSPEWKQYLPTLSFFSNTQEKQQIIDFFKLTTQKFKIMGQHKDLFYPDGYHPNRHAHRLLTNKILELLAI